MKSFILAATVLLVSSSAVNAAVKPAEAARLDAAARAIQEVRGEIAQDL